MEKTNPEDELRSARKEIAFVEYVALPDALAAIARARRDERKRCTEELRKWLAQQETLLPLNAPRSEGENNG